MSLLRKFASRSVVNRALQVAVRNGGGHHGPSVPPFGRRQPPTGTIPEGVELVWDDGVAPEAALDFDAPSISLAQALFMLGCGFGFFALVGQLVKWSDPEGRNPIVTKFETGDMKEYKYLLGMGEPEEYTKSGEAGAEEEEE